MQSPAGALPEEHICTAGVKCWDGRDRNRCACRELDSVDICGAVDVGHVEFTTHQPGAPIT